MYIALKDILMERLRQNTIWGGPDHDDNHTFSDWLGFIESYTIKCRRAVRDHHPGKIRQRFVQIAALAHAGIESLDRKTQNIYMEPEGMEMMANHLASQLSPILEEHKAKKEMSQGHPLEYRKKPKKQNLVFFMIDSHGMPLDPHPLVQLDPLKDLETEFDEQDARSLDDFSVPDILSHYLYDRWPDDGVLSTAVLEDIKHIIGIDPNEENDMTQGLMSLRMDRVTTTDRLKTQHKVTQDLQGMGVLDKDDQ